MSMADDPAIPAFVVRMIGEEMSMIPGNAGAGVTPNPAMRYAADLGQAVSAFRVIGLAEVALRNALDQQLTATWVDWMDSVGPLLSERAQEAIQKARQRAARGGDSGNREAVRSQLSLGFWVYLLSGSYEQRLWVPSLRHAFPELYPARRSIVFRMAHRMLVLRNRIAHHELITRIDIQERLDGTLTLLGWIDPELAEWVRRVTADPIPSPWGGP